MNRPPRDVDARNEKMLSKQPTLSQPTSDQTSPSWLDTYPWATFVLPFVVFTAVGTLEPTTEKHVELLGWSIDYSAYPLIYSIKIALTMASMAAVWPGYRRFAFHVSPLAVAVGLAGILIWIGICKLGIEDRLFGPLGLNLLRETGRRSAFNPFEAWPSQPGWAYGFLAVRFWGLTIVVSVIEEFFLRGLVMRAVVDLDWWKVSFGTLTPAAAIAGTIIPVAMHPAELLAAAVWFSLVTWLMFKTKNIWDCVIAHAITNLLLGVWVVFSGDWYFL